MTLHAAHLVVLSGPAGDDRAEVIEVGDTDVVVVADGAGGTGGGARAADAVIAATRRRAADLAGGKVDAETFLEQLDVVVSRLGGETTAIVAVIDPDGVRGASVGDSEAWVVGDREVVALTEHQQRKPLLGSNAAVVTTFAAGALDGTLVLGTDGLFKYARRDAIAQAARTDDLEAAPAKLVDEARTRSGGLHDDVAVVVVRPDVQ